MEEGLLPALEKMLGADEPDDAEASGNGGDGVRPYRALLEALRLYLSSVSGAGPAPGPGAAGGDAIVHTPEERSGC